MIKQVIVIRKDLKMRRGKEIAQGAHAAMAWLSERLQFSNWKKTKLEPESDTSFVFPSLSDEEIFWVTGSFTKVCLQVNSEQELLAVYDRAKAAGLTVHLITDSGRTEFDGVPTKTCLAIGPHDEGKIDPVTGGLKLY